jgi:hypothetical protein
MATTTQRGESSNPRNDRRKRKRVVATGAGELAVICELAADRTETIRAKLLDIHETGCGLELHSPLKTGANVTLTGGLALTGNVALLEVRGQVAWCRMKSLYTYRVGIIFSQPLAFTADSPLSLQASSPVDYYEALQLSPNAEPLIIRRMYEVLDRYCHPERGEHPDSSKHAAVTEAFRVLSEPASKAAFDAQLRQRMDRRRIFEQTDPADTIQAEQVKRRAILRTLYISRMNDPDHPGLTSAEIAESLGNPPESIGFALWYVREHGWAVRTEGRYAITAGGVDEIELPRASYQLSSSANRTGARKTPRPVAPALADAGAP